MADVFTLPWRVGRKLFRTVYAQIGDEPSDDDIFLGIFDSAEVALAVAEQHNFYLI